jgi:hypothetical protein
MGYNNPVVKDSANNGKKEKVDGKNIQGAKGRSFRKGVNYSYL